ncbi:MAG: DUF4411 family protein [Phycisphaerae bacterium]|nr:DUF4411 family protein [Phycisphaerae bacterium]
MDAWCRWYPPALFPSLWEKIDHMVTGSILVSSDEVYRELERKDDSLFTWAKDRKDIFLPLSDDVQSEVTSILDSFPRLVDARTGKSFADPFVIATAKVTNTIVVTGEFPTSSKQRPKIPDVCNDLEIPWLNIVAMIQEESWTF